MPSLQSKIDEAFAFIRERLFCPETNLVYDYLTSHDFSHRLDHLPYPEEIAAAFPNPCGWGTGMEDSMLNAGSLIDALRLRWEITKDSELCKFAELVIDGMCRCGEIHGKPGFVVRSISPRDGKSCYINSSRDQFTLCVYGAWRFCKTPWPVSDESRRKASRLLCEIADFCAEWITAGHHDSLPSLDGGDAVVSKMINVDVHEIMRLPMFYAAAWQVSGRERYQKLYLQYIDDCIKANYRFERKITMWWDIEFSQMALSLRLLLEIDQDPQRQKDFSRLLSMGAELAEKQLIEKIQQFKLFKGDLSTPANYWREANMVVGPLSCKGDRAAFVNGHIFMMPRFRSEFRDVRELLRSIGNLAYSVAFAPEYQPIPQLQSELGLIISHLNYQTHCSSSPINLLHSYFLFPVKRK